MYVVLSEQSLEGANRVQFSAKYIFVRLFRKSRHLATNSVTHWAGWLSCTFGAAIISYIIASVVPVFGGLVSLIGSSVGVLLSFQPYGAMWLYDNWHQEKSQRGRWWTFMVGWSVFVITAGTFQMVAGTYGSVLGIIDSYKASSGSAAFSCTDNSISIYKIHCTPYTTVRTGDICTNWTPTVTNEAYPVGNSQEPRLKDAWHTLAHAFRVIASAHSVLPPASTESLYIGNHYVYSLCSLHAILR